MQENLIFTEIQLFFLTSTPHIVASLWLISKVLQKLILIVCVCLCVYQYCHGFLWRSRLPEKAMATHSSTLAWEIPWTEEPGRLQSMGSRRVGLDWATSLSLFTFMHWRRKWQHTPVLLPGESQGREPGGLPSMGSHRVQHDWRDLAAAAGFQRSLLCQSRSILASGLIFYKGVKAIHWVKDSLSTNGLKQLNIYMQSINT